MKILAFFYVYCMLIEFGPEVIDGSEIKFDDGSSYY